MYIQSVMCWEQVEALEVLAYGHVGLSNLIWFVQDLFIEGKIGLEGKEDCRLINLVDGSKELGEVEALNYHCCQVTLGFNCKNQIIIKLVDLGNRILEFRVWDRGSGGVGNSCQLFSRLRLGGFGAPLRLGLGGCRLGGGSLWGDLRWRVWH